MKAEYEFYGYPIKGQAGVSSQLSALGTEPYQVVCQVQHAGCGRLGTARWILHAGYCTPGVALL